MKPKLLKSMAVVAALAITPLVFAQRRISPMFADNTTTLTGEVVQLLAMNPQSLLVLDVPGHRHASEATGEKSAPEKVRWQAVLPGQQALSTCFGWNKNTVKPGDTVLMTGHAAKSGMPMITLIEADSQLIASGGKTLLAGTADPRSRFTNGCSAQRSVAPNPSSGAH